jgi:hypothetical protein
MNVAKNLGAAIALALSAGSTAWGIEPANPNASEDARKVLAYLYNLPNQPEHRIISGHFCGGSVGPNDKVDQGFYQFSLQEVAELHELTGQWVGLIGGDYCAGFFDSPNPLENLMYYKDMNRLIIDYWNAGGLIAITTHQFDPRELYKNGGQCYPKDLPKGMPHLDVSRVYTPGTKEYDNFRVIMNRWCEGFQELEDHGVVVLWRPLNEARDGKWWCHPPGDQYQTLYRYIFDYMTHTKGLNNLLWVYDSSGGGGKPPKTVRFADEADQAHDGNRKKEEQPVQEVNRAKGEKSEKGPKEIHMEPREMDLYYYPGDQYVDIIGYTMNWDSGENRDKVRPLPQKVFACIEFNVRTNLMQYGLFKKPKNYDYMKKYNWVKENLPYCSYFMSWFRIWGPNARGTPESVEAMFNDPTVANRGDIKWREVKLSPKTP